MKKIAAMCELMLLLGIVFVPTFASAAGDGTPRGNVITLPNPLGSTTTFAQLLDRILTFLMQAGGIIASIMILIGAFQMLFATGDPEKFATGRRTIIYTVIAYGIIVVAKGIVLVIKDFLT